MGLFSQVKKIFSQPNTVDVGGYMGLYIEEGTGNLMAALPDKTAKLVVEDFVNKYNISLGD